MYTKTVEAIRDQLDVAINAYLSEKRKEVFGEPSAFENFRRRFFNRPEALFSLIQDHPLLGTLRGQRVGIRQDVALSTEELRQVASILVARRERSDSDKPDRRLLLAATEHVAVRQWRDQPEGQRWLAEVLSQCKGLEDKISDAGRLEARVPLSRKEHRGRTRSSDPEARGRSADPLEAEFS